MDQFSLTNDQLAIQEMARRLTADAIKPYGAHWDDYEFCPRANVKAVAARGFAGIDFKHRYLPRSMSHVFSARYCLTELGWRSRAKPRFQPSQRMTTVAPSAEAFTRLCSTKKAVISIFRR